MPIYRLFHLEMPPVEGAWDTTMKEARFDAMTGDVRAAIGHGLYAEIAHVEAETVHMVFPLTNHIESDWTTGQAIRAIAGPARSTSMGDVVMDEAGALFSCAMIGWSPLDPEQDRAFRSLMGGRIATLGPSEADLPAP